MEKPKVSPEFSVIIPIYNEEDNIYELYERLSAVMGKLGAYEIIMVDDGSKDRSWEVIKDIHQRDSRVKGISFSRNFGHHIAITAGLDHAKGNSVILMDGDLQDPPEEIPKLYEKFKEGYDLVYGIRKERHDPVVKKITSFIFWWILRRFSGVDMPAGQTMLRIMSRRLVDVLKEMREYSRFIHGMMAWAGFNAAMVEIKHNPRLRGKSKYNIPRLFRLAFHAVTSFSIVPLRLATYLGLLSSFVSLLTGIYFIYRKIAYNIPVLGYASIIVSIFFVGGIQLLVLGIFGEYLGRTYQEVQRRPLYIIRDLLQ
ncbi:MAG: glycosyltransferase family 2 protein [Thermodesulfovibrionales bacterium]|nr:glycosyltransferase family 2 protein [Thermodesulfovibrionales bacterium]